MVMACGQPDVLNDVSFQNELLPNANNRGRMVGIRFQRMSVINASHNIVVAFALPQLLWVSLMGLSVWENSMEIFIPWSAVQLHMFLSGVAAPNMRCIYMESWLAFFAMFYSILGACIALCQGFIILCYDHCLRFCCHYRRYACMETVKRLLSA